MNPAPMSRPESDVDRPVPPAPALVGHALRRRCPICGERSIWKGWFSLKDACPNCGYVFLRESGYFLGAYALNLIIAELITMVVLVWLLVRTDWEWWVIELIVIPMAIGLPLLLFPYARGLWMALDLTFHPRNQR
jgi:uncharacterized protein (DUF983 family)